MQHYHWEQLFFHMLKAQAAFSNFHLHTGVPKLNNCHKIIFICLRNKCNSYFDISKIIGCTGSQDGRSQKNTVSGIWNHYRQAFKTNNSNRTEVDMTKANCFSYMAERFHDKRDTENSWQTSYWTEKINRSYNPLLFISIKN